MTSGGARNRSGPQADPNSFRSVQRGLVLTALPSEGYRGEVPTFPLSSIMVYWEYFDKGQKIRVPDEAAAEIRREREVDLWQWAWRTPQACAWIAEPWRWQSVAMWVRTTALCESSEATAADKNSLHRFADQIGLTPAGLKENGWAIAKNELDEKRPAAVAATGTEGRRSSSRERLRIVEDASDD